MRLIYINMHQALLASLGDEDVPGISLDFPCFWCTELISSTLVIRTAFPWLDSDEVSLYRSCER